MRGLDKDPVTAGGSGSVVVPDFDSGPGGARRSRLAIVGWTGLAAVVLIGSVVLSVAAGNWNTDKARCDRGCVSVFDLVGPPGQLPSAAQLQAEFSGATVVASWTPGSSDSGVYVPAATSPVEYGAYAACFGGGTMTVIAHSTADQVDQVDQASMTFACDGHMRLSLPLPLGIVADSGQPPYDAGPYRLTVATSGKVSAAELFVLKQAP